MKFKEIRTRGRQHFVIFACMSGQDDLLAKLRQTLNEQGIDSFHILEELIPVEEQMDYFRYFERLRRENKTLCA